MTTVNAAAVHTNHETEDPTAVYTNHQMEDLTAVHTNHETEDPTAVYTNHQKEDPTAVHTNHETEDPTAPFYELESFDSIWQALQWKQLRTRVPVCTKKIIRSRYMLANLVYLAYAIGILIIDFNPDVNGSSNVDTTNQCDNTTTITTTTTSPLDQPVSNVPLVNHFYIGK
jgi:hypothetical protein